MSAGKNITAAGRAQSEPAAGDSAAFIWKGVFSSFDDAASATIGPGFEGETWRTRSLASARICLDHMSAGLPIPPVRKQRSELLPAVAATLLINRDRIRILDFGGGLGIGYMTLLESIPKAAERLSYDIVDLEPMCREGRELFAGAVSYWTEVPRQQKFDLVHAASALQYVRDWKQILQQLGASGAGLMLLSDVFAGPIPTFVTLQRYYDSRIRHWFWNLDEFLTECSGAGFELVMETGASSIGVGKILHMEGFPETHRLQQSLHMLFRNRR